MNTRYLVVIVSAALICPEAMYGRTWTDASGKHQIEAELLGFRDGLVHLKKPDGTVLNIALDKLCPSDQALVRHVPVPCLPAVVPLADHAVRGKCLSLARREFHPNGGPRTCVA